MDKRNNCVRRASGVAAAVALALSGPALASPGELMGPPEPVGPPEVEQGAVARMALQVLVIGASMSGTTDPRLAEWVKEMEAYKFTAYKVLDARDLVVDLKTNQPVPLPGGRTLELKPTKFEKSGKLRVHLHVLSASKTKLVCTEYSIQPGGAFTVAGSKLEDGSTLFILVRHGDAK